ncbi:hypothetical protein HJA87_06260 [Rhizobium bangladeshense]|uniref:CMP/dCMP-type deaminase domain-containing protein n=1 Tax=Rhizobium bangladeshense TaxID=1138189 RepID=A0ABS7LDD9_9HYPH|nr:deaminase [Rhizobium bangladeshense]MBY3589487.1 hypothetical protein [Rhizobium bangladeshense]
MAISHDDRRFLIRCDEVKAMSHDPHRQVGVVIVGTEGTVIAEGTNAPPSAFGLNHLETQMEISNDPSWKYFMLEHAERNAIFSAHNRGISLAGATMYGSLFPCADCARAMVAVGISRVVVSTADNDPRRDEKWRDHYKYARLVFELGGVSVELVERSDTTRSKVG